MQLLNNLKQYLNALQQQIDELEECLQSQSTPKTESSEEEEISSQEMIPALE